MITDIHLNNILFGLILFLPIYILWSLYDAVKKKRDLFNFLKKVLPKEEVKLIRQKRIYIGMPEPLLIYCKGRPNLIKENADNNDYYNHFLYGEYTNRLGNKKYTFRVTTRNSFVESYGDL